MTAMISPRRRELLVSISLVASVACFVLVVWEFVVWKFDLPKALLPTPGQCFNAAVAERVALFRATISTGLAAFSGLLVAVAVTSSSRSWERGWSRGKKGKHRSEP